MLVNNYSDLLIKGFRSLPTSYYQVPLWFAHPRNSYCVYKKPAYLINLEQIEYFFNRMNEPQNKQIPYFAAKFHNLYFHDDFSLPENYDKMLRETLKKFESKLKDTMLVLISDHGHRLTSYYFHTNEGKKEHINPFLSIKLPEKLIDTEFYENFASNKDK